MNTEIKIELGNTFWLLILVIIAGVFVWKSDKAKKVVKKEIKKRSRIVAPLVFSRS